MRGGVDTGVRGTRRKALLALLVIHHGEVVSADRIADAIWAGHPPSGAVGTVQSHVSHLRRSLGPDAGVVVTHPPGYVLNVAATSIDGYRFEELGERGRMLAAGEDHPSALACFDAALALWQGRPFVDLAGLEFAEREADRLEQVRVSVEEFRIDSVLAVGGHSSVVGQLTTLVEDHPFRERFVAQLMLALFREGRQADTLRVFDTARIALRDGLGLDPSSALRELQGAILRQEPALQAAQSGLVLSSTAGGVGRAVAPTATGVPRTIPTGTVTFLFSDIEGSSTFWEQAGSAMAAALARHDEIVRPRLIVTEAGSSQSVVTASA